MPKSGAQTPGVRGEAGLVSCINAGAAEGQNARSKTPPPSRDVYWSPPTRPRSSSDFVRVLPTVRSAAPPHTTDATSLSSRGVLRSAGLYPSRNDSKKCPCRVSFSEVEVVAPAESPMVSDCSTSVDDSLAFRAGWIGGPSDQLLPRVDPETWRGWLQELKTSQVGMRLRAAYLGAMVAGVVAILCWGLIDRSHEGADWYQALEIGVTVVVVLEIAFRIWLEGSGYWTSCGDVLDAVVALVCVAAIAVSYVPSYTNFTGTRSEERYFAFAMRVTRDVVRLLKLM
eukprot:Hpha_TRINITY_DN22722_c0_g1::TRINITY_DN22722_c0_g1_i1::g.34136::m.34136